MERKLDYRFQESHALKLTLQLHYITLKMKLNFDQAWNYPKTLRTKQQQQQPKKKENCLYVYTLFVTDPKSVNYFFEVIKLAQ